MSSDSITETLDRLRGALAGPLPGLPVQMRMSPDPRPGTERILDPLLECRRAAVLVLLYPWQEEICIVLTRRTDSVENHRGQISFPGGSMDPGEDAVTAALREAREELEVDPGAVQVIGRLSPLYIPPSGFCVYPIVAYAERRPAFAPNAGEVAEVLEAPLAQLLTPTAQCREVWEIRGAPVTVPFYAYRAHKVWGATAMILCELISLLQGDHAEAGGHASSRAAAIAAAHDPRLED